jgi:hypothetical protein
MKVIKPTTFVEATHLVSTNAVETYAAYNAATTYAKGARVDYGTHIYESLVNSNIGNTPSTSPTFWVLVGPDNVHAMFDDQISTATVSTSPLTVVMTPGLMNSLALLGLVGNQAVVAITDGAGGPTVYSRTVNLDGSYVYDWYMYFFEPFTQIGEVVFTDIPPYLNARMTLTLSGSGTVAIGQLSFGTFYELGDAEYGATAGITDYSRKDTDEFGATTFVERAFSKRMTARLMLDAMQMNKVQRVLSDVRAKPAVWIGAEGEAYQPLVVYGFYRDFTIDVAYPTKSYCSLEIEGLI